jgi:hypothetical protein
MSLIELRRSAGALCQFRNLFRVQVSAVGFQSAADAEDLEHDQTVFPGSLCQVPSCFHASITHMYWPNSEKLKLARVLRGG